MPTNETYAAATDVTMTTPDSRITLYCFFFLLETTNVCFQLTQTVAVAAVSKSGTDRQTDRRTRDRCIDPAGSDSDCDEKK